MGCCPEADAVPRAEGSSGAQKTDCVRQGRGRRAGHVHTGLSEELGRPDVLQRQARSGSNRGNKLQAWLGGGVCRRTRRLGEGADEQRNETPLVTMRARERQRFGGSIRSRSFSI